ncbi:MAG TPA: nucleotidyltransferase domain-containing protein [Gemmatimonadaceae bacterium]|nr:nucleotidyltransferase domain-containing protein [Gemmatimonadaceae bacterium]
MAHDSSGAVAALARLLAREAPGDVAAVYVFGSHAEGRAHRESDLDVGALLRRDRHPTARARFDAGVRLGAWLVAELRQPLVDLVVLNDAPPGLAARVVTRGVPVYVADAELEHAFRRDAQLRAADLAPSLRRTRRLKLDALAR